MLEADSSLEATSRTDQQLVHPGQSVSALMAASEAASPLVVLNKLRERYRAYCFDLYVLLGDVARVALDLRESEELWLQFIDETSPFWQHRSGRPPKAADRKDALKFTTAYALEAKTRDEAKRASKIALAASVLLNRGVPVEAIPQALHDAGGIEKLAREAARQRRQSHQRNDSQRACTAVGREIAVGTTAQATTVGLANSERTAGIVTVEIEVEAASRATVRKLERDRPVLLQVLRASKHDPARDCLKRLLRGRVLSVR